jgi:hypothetical protein
MSIPLLIGIIGHRELPDEYRGVLEAELSQALDNVRSQMPNTPIVLVSSLAEGADRFGALVGLERGMELIVPLPFERDVFQSDFPNNAEEFENLLKRAQCSFVATESEYSGYEGASRWIARHCQITIAIWDGEQEAPARGGTAHTVRLRHQVGEAGHTLATVADYLGPVLHLHCPRISGVARLKPQWVWPADSDDQTSSLGQLLSPLDEFNREASKVRKQSVQKSLTQLPGHFSSISRLKQAFGLADSLANTHQLRFRLALNASLGLAVIGYIVQQAWATTSGRVAASLFLSAGVLVIYCSTRARNLDRYLEYRALAEVLRVAFFWRLAGVSTTPADRFLNQHWGSLRWVRSAVNALWIPDSSVVPDLELVKDRWVDDQQTYFERQSVANGIAARRSRWLTNTCFGVGVMLSWLGAFKPEWGGASALGSGILLMIVGAISHFAHTRGWEEDASRYRAMAEPFSWCQQIWRHDDEKTRLILVQELGGECVAELSNWLLTHSNRPVGLMKG